MHTISAILAVALLAGSALAQTQPTRPPPPAVDCDDCFGLAAKPPQDFSYEPLLTHKPYGEANCGETGSLTSSLETERALSQYPAFVQLATGTFRRGVIFQGTSEDAIGCMILLARVKQSRIEAGLLDAKHSTLPSLYGWKALFVRFDPKSGRKLIWIPLRPTAAEQVDLPGYLQRTTQTIIGALHISLADLRAHDVHVTVGYQQQWVTASVLGDGDALAITLSPGMQVRDPSPRPARQ